MKKIKALLFTSTLILGSLGVSYLLYENPKDVENIDNTAIIEDNYVITSEEESMINENVTAFKSKTLLTLKNNYRYELDVINSSISGIDTEVYTEQGTAELKAEYFEDTGREGSLKQALLWQSEQKYNQNVEDVEEYTEKVLDRAIMQNKKAVTIPDEALKQALQTEIETTENEIYFKDIARITKLDLKGLNITSFEGLEYAVNLASLNLEGAVIDPNLDFEPLGLLQNLKELNLLNIFTFDDLLPLENLPDSLKTVSLEEKLYPTNTYTFKLIPYKISNVETESIEPTPEDFFIFDSETKTIEGFTDKVDQTLYIPAEINGIVVEEIAREAFKGKGIKTLKLPETLKYLGDDSFLENELTEVEVDAATENKNWAFDYEINVTTTGGI